MSNDESTASSATTTHEDQIRGLVARLGRPHASGGTVIERAALLAEGGDFSATMAWIVDHGGLPEASPRAAPSRGLYGLASNGSGAAGSEGTPQRFVLPADALTRAAACDAPEDHTAHITEETRDMRSRLHALRSRRPG